jgi:hypothetical protein
VNTVAANKIIKLTDYENEQKRMLIKEITSEREYGGGKEHCNI